MTYFDGRDYRGFLIMGAFAAFVASLSFYLRTLDLPAGLSFGRTTLTDPQVGDAAYGLWAKVSFGIGVLLAVLASVRRLWER